MIRLTRPGRTPAVLRRHGAEATREDCEAYAQAPDVYRSGERTFKFKKLYRSPQVKDALKEIQHDKCCYCERRVAPSEGQVDHFRPKGAFRQSKDDRNKEHPGYYWLAYQWDNLVLACGTCNLKKSDYFPLQHPEQRARSHLDSVDTESPLLLNPYVETELREHLTFNGSGCEHGTERGRVTVEVLRLNEPYLQEERQYVLRVLEFACDVLCAEEDPSFGDIVRDARRRIMEAAQRNAPFSAMARDYLRYRSIDVEIDDTQ